MEKNQLTHTTHLFRDFFQYVAMNVMGMIGLSCYILADTFFVANGLGSTGLSALNLAIPIYSLINGTGLMIGIGGATRYAILCAQKKRQEADQVAAQAATWGAGIGILLFICGLTVSGQLSRWLGADQETFAMTSVYLKTLLCFSPMFILNNILIAFVRNDGAPHLSMTAMLTGSFSNIVLDYVFIFPMKMGMFGAAFATGLAPVISMAVLLIHFAGRKNKLRFAAAVPKLQYLKDVIMLGCASFITEISSGIVIIVFNMVILSLNGNIGVAAYGIIANLALVAVAIFTGVAQGIQPLVSRGYGSGDHKTVRTVLRYAVILSLITAVLLILLILRFSGAVISVFNSSSDLVLAQIAQEGIAIYFFGFLFAGVNIVMASYFSSLERPAYSLTVSMMRGCAAIIPAVLVLSRLFGMSGIWLSFPVAEGITCLISILTFFRMNRKGLAVGRLDKL